MKLIIDISEDDYRKVQDGRASVSMMLKAIGNGTPLSKGHGKLIDVSEYFQKEFGDAREFLNKATTIIEADGGDAE